MIKTINLRIFYVQIYKIALYIRYKKPVHYQSFVQKGIGVKYIGIHSNALQPLYLHSFIA